MSGNYKRKKCIDERIGEYEDVNEAVRKFSQGALEDVSPVFHYGKTDDILRMFWSVSAVLSHSQRCYHCQP